VQILCEKIPWGGTTRMKKHLAEKVKILRDALNTHRTYGNTSYELQRVRERKNAINDERLHRVQSTILEPDDEDEHTLHPD
jgi:hypothetical protein